MRLNRIIITIVLLVFSDTIHSGDWKSVKIQYQQTTTSNVQAELFIGPGSCILLSENSPNHLISIVEKQIELLISISPDSLSPICDPVPPQFVEWTIIELGFLIPGEYTLVVNYVQDDSSLPPTNGVQIYPFGGPVIILIPTPIPSINILGILSLISLIVLVTIVKWSRNEK